MADNKRQEELRQMTDPVAYRDNPQSGYDKYIEWWDASKLKNADVNLSQYWDDSSATNYNNQSLWWGENQKYTGENTLGSQVAYNPNATLEWLDPNYKYGQAAQMANSQNANYIASRNDEIASALYNAWKTSIQDVNDFLSTQTGWDYSNANERANTVASVRKRIGQIAQQQWPKDQPKDQPKPERETIKGEKSDWKIYGKATADSGEPIEWIDTLTDANNIYNSLIASRQANLDTLYNMSTDVIAASIANGINPYGEQAMVDYQRAYPQLYAEVQRKVKEIKWQDAINSITHWSADYVESDVETSKKLTESNKEIAASTYAENSESVSSIINEINQELMSDQTAEEASKTMDRIEWEVAKLKNRLQNLRQEANTVFKWDAPDYLVRAYMNNKTQDINNQLSILADRYSMASNRYNQQWENEWKQKEYNLKERQVKLQEEQFEYNKQKSQVENSQVIEKDWVFYSVTYDEDWKPTIREEVVIKEYAWTWMKWAWLKNNNPGNIKDKSFWNVIGTWNNGFAQFATPEDGFDALVEKIKFNQNNPNSRYYWDTILEYFKKYAPESDWNNPVAYANSVAKELWVSVNTKIADLDPLEFAKVIARHESGYNYDTYGQYRAWTPQTSSSSDYTIDPDTIDVPDSIYREAIWENKDWTKIYRDIDPNSEEWKALREKYINDYIEANKNNELVAREDLGWKEWAAFQLISSDDELPIYYRQRIYNLVPTKMKDSDFQLKQLYKDIVKLYNMKFSADEAALAWYGIDPSKDKTGILKETLYTARASWKDLGEKFYADLGTFAEAGDSEKLVELIENTVLTEKQQQDEDDAVALIDKIHELEDLLDSKEWKEFMEQVEKDVEDEDWADDVTWFVKGNIASLENRYVRTNSKYAKIAAKIAGIYADIRKKYLGSQITETELKANSDLYPSMTDYLPTIRIKLDIEKENVLDDVNSVRKRYRLPLLDEDTLTNYASRKYLYGGVDTSSWDEGSSDWN